MFDSSQTVTLQAANLRFKLANPYNFCGCSAGTGAVHPPRLWPGTLLSPSPEDRCYPDGHQLPCLSRLPTDPRVGDQLMGNPKDCILHRQSGVRSCQETHSELSWECWLSCPMRSRSCHCRAEESSRSRFAPLAEASHASFWFSLGHCVWAKQFLLVPWRAPPRLSWWIVARLNSPTCVTSTLWCMNASSLTNARRWLCPSTTNFFKAPPRKCLLDTVLQTCFHTKCGSTASKWWSPPTGGMKTWQHWTSRIKRGWSTIALLSRAPNRSMRIRWNQLCAKMGPDACGLHNQFPWNVLLSCGFWRTSVSR